MIHTQCKVEVDRKFQQEKQVSIRYLQNNDSQYSIQITPGNYQILSLHDRAQCSLKVNKKNKLKALIEC